MVRASSDRISIILPVVLAASISIPIAVVLAKLISIPTLSTSLLLICIQGTPPSEAFVTSKVAAGESVEAPIETLSFAASTKSK